VQRVAGLVVGLADGLQLGLDVAQLGHARLQRVGGLQHGQLDPLFLGGRVAVLEEPELVQLERALLLQAAVTGGHLGLLSSLSRLALSSRRMSSTRVRFSRVSFRRFSVSRRRSLYLETPAASSRNRRSSSGRDSMMRLMVPWPMMA
jgi:hypothetical protein